MWMQNIRWPNQDRKVGFATYVEFKDNVTAHWFDWLDKNELNSLTCWCKVCDILTSNRAARTQISPKGCNITNKVAILPKRLQYRQKIVTLPKEGCNTTHVSWCWISTFVRKHVKLGCICHLPLFYESRCSSFKTKCLSRTSAL